jgi:dCTP deaminase
VTPNDQTADPTTVTVRMLNPGEAFTIPPGQFAFLLTEEVVSVPASALAFISIRAKIKFRGLVNVSGFHVDPGYRGQLTFAVFNAGPVPIHLKRGQPIFLIWYANLDRNSDSKKHEPIHKGIETEMITAVSGELQSFAGLSKKIKDVDTALGDRVHSVEREDVLSRHRGNCARNCSWLERELAEGRGRRKAGGGAPDYGRAVGEPAMKAALNNVIEPDE